MSIEKNRKLIEAVRRSQLTKVQEAIVSGADVNRFDEFGKTPLLYAAEKHKDEIVQVLLTNGADPNLQSHGISPIHLGVWDLSTLIALIRAGADVNAKIDENAYKNKSWWKRTALMQVADMSCHYSFNHHKIIQTLINNDAKLDIKDFYKNTALMLAQYRRDKEIINILLAAGASDEGMNGVSLLMASESNKTAQVRSLLTIVKNVDGARNFNGRTALHLAVPTGSTEIIDLLISAGASTDVIDCNGHTPLISAILAGQVDTIKLLLDQGADPSFKDGIGRSPLACVQSARASESDQLRMHHILREYGALY